MAWVYFLQEENNGRFYIGSTDDLGRRLRQHQAGHTHSTRRFNNPSLVFYQEFNSLELARKIELRLKKLRKRSVLERIVREGVIKIEV